MNHAPIVVSENGYKAMCFSSDFNKWAKEHNIRDPFAVSQKLFSKRMHRNADGSTSVDIEIDETTGKIKADPQEPTRKEKDNWIQMRDAYVARRCFYEIGYESFLLHSAPKDYECNYDISYLRDLDEFVPCRSADRQCSLECKKYAECVLEGTWKPE